MKRKYIQTITEINHEYHLITQQKIIYSDKQEILEYNQEFIFNYCPKKRIKMTKRKNTRDENEIVKRTKATIDVLEETRLMTSQEKGKWFERKVNETLKTEGMVTTPSSDGYYDKKEGYIMTGDGGIDISGHYQEKYFIVQCKCHREPISASVVREMKGLIATKEDTLGVICAITFSQNAISEARNSNGKIILTTINDIAKQIQEALLNNNITTKQVKMTYQEATKIEYTRNSLKMEEIKNGEIIFQY
jgi:hypothetical protein